MHKASEKYRRGDAANPPMVTPKFLIFAEYGIVKMVPSGNGPLVGSIPVVRPRSWGAKPPPKPVPSTQTCFRRQSVARLQWRPAPDISLVAEEAPSESHTMTVSHPLISEESSEMPCGKLGSVGLRFQPHIQMAQPFHTQRMNWWPR